MAPEITNAFCEFNPRDHTIIRSLCVERKNYRSGDARLVGMLILAPISRRNQGHRAIFLLPESHGSTCEALPTSQDAIPIPINKHTCEEKSTMAKKRGARANRGNPSGNNRGSKGSMAQRISDMEAKLKQEHAAGETNLASLNTANAPQTGSSQDTAPLPIPPKAPERGLTNSEKYEFARRTPIERGRAKPIMVGGTDDEDDGEAASEIYVATASPVTVHSVPHIIGGNDDPHQRNSEEPSVNVGLGTVNSGLPTSLNGSSAEDSSEKFERRGSLPRSEIGKQVKEGENADELGSRGLTSPTYQQENGDYREEVNNTQLSPNETIKVVSTGTTTPAESWQEVPSPSDLNEHTKKEVSAQLSSEVIGVCVVGFHATRGPEVEYWAGPRDMSQVWPYLPFQSLPDGSHQFEESLCYFTLLYDEKSGNAPSLVFERDQEGHIVDPAAYRNVRTLFAASCCRREKSSDEVRGVVQKAVVVVARRPLLGPVKEKLTVVTRSYFAQGDFQDRTIIDHLYSNLRQQPFDPDVTPGLRHLVHKFKEQTLFLFKAMLSESKILFYAEDSERLCMTQFSLVALIPGLLNHLEDCGSPLLSTYETQLKKPTFVRTSDHDNLLEFIGLPLQVFGGGGLFSPFVPLQQLSDLRERESAFGLVGTTNHVFLESTDQFDIVVNIDQGKIEHVSRDLISPLQLSSSDRKFIQAIVKAVDRSWTDDESERWFPPNLGYEGSDDHIRHMFENYLSGLLSSAKYDQHIRNDGPKRQNLPEGPLSEYGVAFAERWSRTNNFRIFNKFTDEELFDVVSPEHPGSKLGRKFLFWQK